MPTPRHASHHPRAPHIIAAAALALGTAMGLAMFAAMTGVMVMGSHVDACVEGGGDCGE